ncbi:MAG: DUF5320 domain-containing protein [Candidatus Fermentibacterota bacterium]
MPAGDRTGPDGFGPMTGRGLGYCTGHAAPGYARPAPGRGMGRGWGRGMGRGRGWGRRGYYAPYPTAAYPVEPPSREQEMEGLKRAAEETRQALKRIEDRMEQLGEE